LQARERAANYLGEYYAFAGSYRDMVVQSALSTDNLVQDAIAAYRATDCDELILAPCDPDTGQVDALAAVAFTSAQCGHRAAGDMKIAGLRQTWRGADCVATQRRSCSALVLGADALSVVAIVRPNSRSVKTVSEVCPR